jgi:hemoglobin
MVDDRLNKNPRVDEAHHKVLPPGFKYLVTEMLAEAAGGPQRYTGRSMQDSHRELLITGDEWDAFIDDLNQTLDKFQVPQQERLAVLAIIQSTRGDIVVEAAERPPTASTAEVV